MDQMLTGAIAVGWLVAGLYFLRFWQRTGDRFFLYFVASFWIESASRMALGLLVDVSEDNPLLYCPRLVAYGLILMAIWQKNRPER